MKNIDGLLVEIVCVHIPIGPEFVMEAVLSEEFSSVLYKACELANALGQCQNRLIHMVIHHNMTLPKLEQLGLYEIIKAKVSALLEEFANIILNFENVMIVSLEQGSLVTRNNYKYDNIALCLNYSTT